MTTATIPDTDADQVELVLATLKAVVDEAGPDFIYRPKLMNGQEICFYVNADTETPDCIAGHVLHRLGVPLSVLAAQEGNCVSELDPGDSSVWLAGPALQVLEEAQEIQDQRKPWGDALYGAQLVAERYRARRG